MELFDLMQTILALLGLGITLLGLQKCKLHLRRFLRR